MAIKDFQNHEEISETFLLLSKQLKPFRNKSGSYLEVELRDSTGSIKGRLWENGEDAYHYLSEGKPVEVKGRIQEFMGGLQLIIDYIETSNCSCGPEDFLPRLQNYAEIKEEFIDKLETLKERAEWSSAGEVKILLENIFDNTFLERFCEAPAAIKYHHPYLGGLMHHTLGVAKNAESMAKNYPEADLVITLTGAFLHDLGKLKEYTLSRGVIEQSIEGVLMGHIVLGLKILQDAVKQIRERGLEFSEELEKLLQHIIASHHSEGEWGSPRQPAVLEALLVHQADLLDAEAYKFLECEGEKGTYSWSSLLKRNLYIKEGNWDLPF